MRHRLLAAPRLDQPVALVTARRLWSRGLWGGVNSSTGMAVPNTPFLAPLPWQGREAGGWVVDWAGRQMQPAELKGWRADHGHRAGDAPNRLG